MRMDIRRVVEDARHGVSAARVAWRLRDPAAAAAVLGHVVEPSEQRAANAVREFFDNQRVLKKTK